MADEVIGIEVVATAMTAGLERVNDKLEEMAREIKRVNRAEAEGNAVRKVSITTGNKWADTLLNMKNKAGGFGWALKALKLPVVISLLKTGVPLLMSWAGGLAAIIGNMSRMSGLVGLLPGFIIGLGGMFAVVKTGFMGIGDAVKAMTKEGATVAEVAEATKNLPGPAKAFAEQLARWKNLLKPLRETAAGAILPAFSGALGRMTKLLPMGNRLLRVFGHTVSSTVTDLSKFVTSDGFMRDFETIGNTSAGAMRNLGMSLRPVLSILRHVAVAAGPTLQALSRVIRTGAESLEMRAAAGRGSGRMQAFFARALESARQWGRIIGNLSSVIFNFFKAGGKQGSSLADSLERITKYWKDWTGSVNGQNKMAKWFDDIRPILTETGYLLRDIWRAFGVLDESGRSSVVPFIHALRKQLLPAIVDITKSMDGGFLPAITQLAGAIVKVLNIASFSPLRIAIDVVGKLVLGLTLLTDKYPVIGKLLTGLIAVGLAFKTTKLLGSLTGISQIVRLFAGGQGARAGGAIWRFAAGMKAMRAAQAGTSITSAISGIAGGGGMAARLGALAAGGGGAGMAGAGAAMAAAAPWIALGAAIAGVAAVIYIHRQKIGGFFLAIGRWFASLPGLVMRGLRGFGDMLHRNLVQPVKDTWHRLQGLSRIPGTNIQLLGGDTRSSKARSGGNLARSMAMHGAIDSSVPGRRQITNVFRAALGGPDHPAGRAFDIVGSGLQSYASRLRAMGGYAEFHGSGAGRHLHGVYGDTVGSRAGRGVGMGGGGTSLTINGPLIGHVTAASDVDLRHTVQRALEDWMSEREQRA